MAIVVPLKDGANYLGDVDIQITPDDAILVSLERLIELVGPRLDTARLSDLRGTPTQQGFAPIAAFATRGLPLSFDKRTLELSMTVATADRALRTIALSDVNPDAIGEFQAPEDFSAYVNVRGSIDYVHKGSLPGFGDPFLLFDGAARIGKVIFVSLEI